VGGLPGALHQDDRPILEKGAAALLSATQVTLVAGIGHGSVGARLRSLETLSALGQARAVVLSPPGPSA
jgi:hypothetical protein